MILGAFVAPLALLIWRKSRVIGALTLADGRSHLAFDYTDVLRYVLDNRTPLPGSI